MSAQQQSPNKIAYPEFILAIDAAYAKKIVDAESALVPYPMWTLIDGGKETLWDNTRPNSAVVNRHLVIAQREGLETDPTKLQILPYTLFGYQNDDFSIDLTTYFRKKGEGEARLDGKQSLGWGGHIEMADIAFTEQNDIDLVHTIQNNVEREGAEEIIFVDENGNEVDIHAILALGRVEMGFIYDTANDVGRVHLAVVSMVFLPKNITVKKREKVHLDGPVMSLEQIAQDIQYFEPWSRIVADFMHQSLATAAEHLAVAKESLAGLQERIVEQHQQLAATGERTAALLQGQSPEEITSTIANAQRDVHEQMDKMKSNADLPVHTTESTPLYQPGALQELTEAARDAALLQQAADARTEGFASADEVRALLSLETTTPSGLKYLDIVEGDGAKAVAGQTVSVHYTGYFTDGRKFDSSKDRLDPFAFVLGAGMVIKGWDEGVQGMKVGGKRKLTIPPQLGYGVRGAGGVIPPNATLVFEVELLSV